MLKKDLAAALGISASMVSRLTKQGMPTDSAAAAQAWRAAHLDPARVVRARADTQGQLNPLTLVQRAEGAMEIARAALDAGADFERFAPVVRAALKAVPVEHRHLVGLDLQVMRRLCAPLLALLRDCGARDDEQESPDDAASDDQHDPGRVLYGFACGEIRIAGSTE